MLVPINRGRVDILPHVAASISWNGTFQLFASHCLWLFRDGCGTTFSTITCARGFRSRRSRHICAAAFRGRARGSSRPFGSVASREVGWHGDESTWRSYA